MTSAWIFNIGAWLYAAMNAQAAWRQSCDLLAAHYPPEAGPRALDLGCGPGFSTIALARARPDAVLVGLDLAPRMLRAARRRVAPDGSSRRPALLRADAARLPFRDGRLDIVTGHSFLYLVDQPDAVLAEVWRVLRPEGRLVLMEPNDRWVPLRAVLRHSRDPRFLFSMLLWRLYSRRHGRFSASSLRATLTAAGFVSFGAEEVLAGLGLLAWATRPSASEKAPS